MVSMTKCTSENDNQFSGALFPFQMCSKQIDECQAVILITSFRHKYQIKYKKMDGDRLFVYLFISMEHVGCRCLCIVTNT